MLHLHSSPSSFPPLWPDGKQLANLSSSQLNTKYSPTILESYPTPISGQTPPYSQERATIKAEHTTDWGIGSAAVNHPASFHCRPKPGYMSRPMSGFHGAQAQHGSSEPADHHGLNSNNKHNASFTQSTGLAPPQLSQASNRTVSRPASPVKFDGPSPEDRASGRKSSTSHHAIASYLHLPPEIANGRQASLAEFTAQITCLFWFEDTAILQQIEQSPTCPIPTTRLAPKARPGTGFLKCVTTMLTTTALSSNVALLALMFIYRLKKQVPMIQGKVGSEFRLLTVALMLGNKFLDDHTYTNKTWSEVSGISTYQIHVMEVEFLSHMKYNLYTSKEQWKDWFQQLSKFWTYFEWASVFQESIPPVPTTAQIPSLTLSYRHVPSTADTSAGSPTYTGVPTPPSTTYSGTPNYSLQLAPLSFQSTNHSPNHEQEAQAQAGGRKRSHDEALYHDSWPKRRHVQELHQTVPMAYSSQAQSQADPLPSLSSLPVPHLPMPMPMPMQYHQQPQSGHGLNSVQSHTPAALRGVPTQSSSGWLQGVSALLAGQGQSDHRAQWTALPRNNTPNNGAFTGSNPSTESGPRTSTPSNATFAMPGDNEPQLSPSYYLNERPSPYRPVQHLSHLTQMPPHAVPQFHPRISHEQIRWQPLKKVVGEDERRFGRLPYYDRNVWSALQQPQQQYGTVGHH